MRLKRPKDTFDNTVKQPSNPAEVTANTASRVLPLESDEIHYWGQIVAVVVAESFEVAQAAADLVTIQYEEQTPTCSFRDSFAQARKPSSYLGEPIVVVGGTPKARSQPRTREQTGRTPRPCKTATPWRCSRPLPSGKGRSSSSKNPRVTCKA